MYVSNRRMRNPKENENPAERGEGLLLLSQFTMAANDYWNMLGGMKKLTKVVIRNDENISEYVRDFLCSAFKILIDFNLDCWRHVRDHSISEWREPAREYMELIADKILEICEDIVELIDGRLLLVQGEGELGMEKWVFYKKIKGDFLGHLAMLKNAVERVKTVKAHLEAHNNVAMEEEELELPKLNPTQVKLLFNLAFFHVQICESFKSVFSLAFDMAKRLMISKGEEICSELTVVLEAIQNRIDSWTTKIASQP